MIKINDYGFNMGGVVPNAKDIYEAALHHIMQHEKENPAVDEYAISTYIVDGDENWCMTINTPHGSYLVDNIKEHDAETADNYVTFTLSIQ